MKDNGVSFILREFHLRFKKMSCYYSINLRLHVILDYEYKNPFRNIQSQDIDFDDREPFYSAGSSTSYDIYLYDYTDNPYPYIDIDWECPFDLFTKTYHKSLEDYKLEIINTIENKTITFLNIKHSDLGLRNLSILLLKKFNLENRNKELIKWKRI